MQSKEWRAIALEAKLTRQLCGAGLTAISRANYADGMGEYYTAFFSLSVGIERLAKLILCVEHYMNNAGAFPLEKEMRAYGHKIERLITQIKSIQGNRSIKLKFGMADDLICEEIVRFLDVFSDAKRGRYANLAALINPNFDARNEPIALWYERVGQTILDKHFRGKPIEAKARKNPPGKCSQSKRHNNGDDRGAKPLQVGVPCPFHAHTSCFVLLYLPFTGCIG